MLTLLSSRFSFRSSAGVNQSYCIEVAVDASGRANVVGVRSEKGGTALDPCSCPSQMPEEVVADLGDAVEAALALWRRDLVGTVDVLFTGQTSIRVDFPWGPLGTEHYLVVVTAARGFAVRAVDRTRTGLTLLAPAPLGALMVPIKVTAAVYVPAFVAGPLGFEAVFTSADAPVRKVQLPKPVSPDAYHVLVDPVGMFPAALGAKTRESFEIVVGALPPPGQRHHVRYLVVVP